MKIAVLGGSFNPVHNGHLALADAAARELGFDRILFIPDYVPPHKDGGNLVSAENRLEMVRLAVSEDERFECESCEIDRGGISYTYDTIQFLKEKYKGQIEGKIGIIMGQELAAEFSKWYKAEKLASECELIVALRKNPLAGENSGFVNAPSGSYTGGLEASGEFSGFDAGTSAFTFTELKNPLVTVSSTQIRKQIAEGASWKYLVPPQVFDYITVNRLYGFDGSY